MLSLRPASRDSDPATIRFSPLARRPLHQFGDRSISRRLGKIVAEEIGQQLFNRKVQLPLTTAMLIVRQFHFHRPPRA